VPVIVATKKSRRSMERAAAEVGLLNCPAIPGWSIATKHTARCKVQPFDLSPHCAGAI
jgi:hypothetical protein